MCGGVEGWVWRGTPGVLLVGEWGEEAPGLISASDAFQCQQINPGECRMQVPRHSGMAKTIPFTPNNCASPNTCFCLFFLPFAASLSPYAPLLHKIDM